MLGPTILRVLPPAAHHVLQVISKKNPLCMALPMVKEK